MKDKKGDPEGKLIIVASLVLPTNVRDRLISISPQVFV